MEGRKFSMSVRVDSITPCHIRLSVFSNMIPVEANHNKASRAKSGELTLRVEEFGPFLDHVRPHSVKHFGVPLESIEKYTGVNPERLVIG